MEIDNFKSVMNKVIKLQTESNSNVLIRWVTASGKSGAFYKAISNRSGLFLIICPTIALVNEHYDNLKKEKYVYLEYNEIEKNGIFILGIEKSNKIKDLSLFTRIIYDEFHVAYYWNSFRPQCLEILNKLLLFARKQDYYSTRITLVSSTISKQQMTYLSNLKIKVSTYWKIKKNIKLFIVDDTPQFSHGIYFVHSKKCFDNIEEDALKCSSDNYDDLKKYISGESKLYTTKALGIGININAKIIVHDYIPASIEDYFQEISRGGRNGEDCSCYLVRKNKIKLSENNNEGYKKMLEFIDNKLMCRQVLLALHFGIEKKSYIKCDNCDNCLNIY